MPLCSKCHKQCVCPHISDTVDPKTPLVCDLCTETTVLWRPWKKDNDDKRLSLPASSSREQGQQEQKAGSSTVRLLNESGATA